MQNKDKRCLNHIGSKTLLHLTVILLLTCGGENDKIQSCNRKSIFIYLTNSSLVDTLAYTKIYINDSIIFDEKIKTYKGPNELFWKKIKLCGKNQKIRVQFGRYQKDTIMTFKNDVALYISMDYEKLAYTANNGLTIVQIDRSLFRR